jgi:hypothetical protein
MRRSSLLLGCGAVAVWLQALPLAFAQDPNLSTPDGLRALLEQTGATIREIRITVDNVFDPNNPEENKKLYRWANNVHVLTREKVIADVLLFEVGDTFRARLLDESARALRGRGFIAEATIVPVDYDPATNSAVIVVHVRDAWSLAFDL